MDSDGPRPVLAGGDEALLIRRRGPEPVGVCQVSTPLTVASCSASEPAGTGRMTIVYER